MPVRSTYVDKACQACRSSKRKCLRDKPDDEGSCKRCNRMGFECIVEFNDDRRKVKRKSRQSSEQHRQIEFIPSPYNFLLLEAGGLPLSEDRLKAINATSNGNLPSVTQIDWLIDEELCAIISRWSDLELGSLFPQLPPAGILRSQRQHRENEKESINPALLILEFAQYLCASRHLNLSPSIKKRFPGVEIEAMVRPLLQHCLSQILLRTSFTPSICLAFQLLCYARIDCGHEKQDAPYTLLSSAIRSVQIARASQTQERDSLTLNVLWCSAFTNDISYMLGTKEGQRIFNPSTYIGLCPNAKDMDRIIGMFDNIADAGYIGLYQKTPLNERRCDALKVTLNRASSTIVFCKAWQDIWQSTKVLREDKTKHMINDEDQLICLAKTGQAMSSFDEMGKRLFEHRLKAKEKISESVFEFLEVEAQFAQTLLLGHCLRMQIESAIDVDVLEEFSGIGKETALLTFVRLIISQNVRAARETFQIDQTRLDAAKAVLAEQVGKLANLKERERNREDDEREIVYPALISLGHFFEAAKEVLHAYAPHLEVSRSNLALHDSWAILAWAVKGLVTSLLVSEISDSNSSISPSSSSSEEENTSNLNKIEIATQILERHCQHVEARMILDLPFPLPSTQPNLIIDNPIALA